MKRPARAILTLLVVLLLALGVTAYLVNVPLLWVIGGEILALGGVALGVSRPKRPQQVSSGAEDGESRPE